MDETALKTLLETTGLPVAYHSYKKPPPLPYIVYLLTNTENFGADDRVYARESNYLIELYTEKKDPAVEKLLEDVLDNSNIFWDKTETFIQSEGFFQVAYFI